MEIGDIVNIKNPPIWKGEIIKVITKLSTMRLLHNIFLIKEINGMRHSVVLEKNMVFHNGEYWNL